MVINLDLPINITALGSYSVRPDVIQCMKDLNSLYFEPEVGDWFSCVLVNRLPNYLVYGAMR